MDAPTTVSYTFAVFEFLPSNDKPLGIIITTERFGSHTFVNLSGEGFNGLYRIDTVVYGSVNWRNKLFDGIKVRKIGAPRPDYPTHKVTTIQK